MAHGALGNNPFGQMALWTHSSTRSLVINMKKCILQFAWLLLLASPCSGGLVCQMITVNDLKGKDIPRFEAFSTPVILNLKPAEVDLKSNPRARRYRTRICEGAAEGPNFAGHFTIVGWGCGTSCVQWAVVDARTGAVYLPPDEIASISTAHVDIAEGEPEPHFYGLRFRIDSELLLILGAPNEDESREGILFYQWTGKSFKFLKAYKIQGEWCKEN